ncbi:MAG: hypothetical protein OEW53_08515 [Actinomycetota bacterium]|nr:hypothetical protein [Actinomycetota bacterium]
MSHRLGGPASPLPTWWPPDAWECGIPIEHLAEARRRVADHVQDLDLVAWGVWECRSALLLGLGPRLA